MKHRSQRKSHKRSRKGSRKGSRKFSVCRNYKKSKCATDNKCSWRKNTGCVVARGKSKSKMNKSFMNMIKGGLKLKHVGSKLKMD